MACLAHRWTQICARVSAGSWNRRAHSTARITMSGFGRVELARRQHTQGSTASSWRCFGTIRSTAPVLHSVNCSCGGSTILNWQSGSPRRTPTSMGWSSRQRSMQAERQCSHRSRSGWEKRSTRRHSLSSRCGFGRRRRQRWRSGKKTPKVPAEAPRETSDLYSSSYSGSTFGGLLLWLQLHRTAATLVVCFGRDGLALSPAFHCSAMGRASCSMFV